MDEKVCEPGLHADLGDEMYVYELVEPNAKREGLVELTEGVDNLVFPKDHQREKVSTALVCGKSNLNVKVYCSPPLAILSSHSCLCTGRGEDYSSHGSNEHP